MLFSFRFKENSFGVSFESFAVIISKFYQFFLNLFQAFTCSALMLPVQLCVEKNVDFEKLLNGDATFKQKLFKNAKYQDRIKKILPKLYAMGIFDEM